MSFPWQALRRAGVLGMNRRNLGYVLKYNPRSRYPLVDDKLKTKRLAQQAGIAIPPLYGVIEIQRQVRELTTIIEGHDDFVIKPAQGSGGNGIIVIDGKRHGIYRKVNGELISEHELHHHISNILSGMYSLGGMLDKALVEYRINFDPVFADVTYQGVPDVRIIIYRGIPVMAMLRLPTQQSEGKANLHQGAIGCGIALSTGITTYAVMGNHNIQRHPDTDMPLSGLQIPYWKQMLLTAARCYELTGLGYIGADFILDRERGSLLLELNARPGLNIQLANSLGLQQRLEQVESVLRENLLPEARVEYALKSL